MWLAWVWVLGFGFIPYLLLYLLPIKRMPGILSESTYNFGVAMITVRSIFKGVLIIYNTTGDSMILAYTIIAVVSLSIGVISYLTGLFTNKEMTVQ